MNNHSLSRKSITVSPPTQYLSLKAGEIYSGSISISNPADSTEMIEYHATISPYSINTNNYSANFTNNSAYTDITNWITLDENHGFINPNEKTDIHFTITVPKDTPGGGQYCAITINNINDDKKTTINEIVEIASIIYARIDGEINESGNIEFHSVPSFVLTPPIKTTSSFTNSGNVHLNAITKTQITNAFTGEKIYNNTEKNYITETIMPDSTRVVNYTYNNIPELGVFNFSQTISYNDNDLYVEKLIFVCPIWFLLLVSFTVVFIILTIILRIKKSITKKKNRKNANIA